MVGQKISRYYTDDYANLIATHKRYRVCDTCGTVNEKNIPFCISCGKSEFSDLTPYEVWLLSTPPDLRDRIAEKGQEQDGSGG